MVRQLGTMRKAAGGSPEVMFRTGKVMAVSWGEEGCGAGFGVFPVTEGPVPPTTPHGAVG